MTDEHSDYPRTVTVDVLADIPWYGTSHVQGEQVELTISTPDEAGALEWLVATNRVRVLASHDNHDAAKKPKPAPHHDPHPKHPKK